MSYGGAISEGLGCMFTLLIGSILCAIIFGAYILVTTIKGDPKIMESKVIIKPDFRLEANGKKVDTIWIYNFKK
jgi:membrane protein CcdC involved in cytochrome C biogenesis